MFCIWVVDNKLAGITQNENYKTNYGLKFLTLHDVMNHIFDEIDKKNGLIVAYSTAEKEIIKKMELDRDLKKVNYLNLLKAAKVWKNKYHRNEFENLKPLRQNVNPFIGRTMRHSLASLMRLVDTEFQAPIDYAPGKTTSRINSVIRGLHNNRNNGSYYDLTAVNKAKATKLLKHNEFDVKGMEILMDEIKTSDISCFKKAYSDFVT